MYASLNPEGGSEIKKIFTEHLCVGAPGSTRTTAKTQSWLQRIVPDLLSVSTHTIPQDIDTVSKHFRVDSATNLLKNAVPACFATVSHIKLSSAP